MRRTLFGVFAALLLASPFTANCQTDQAEPYEFKGNRLGADLGEFKSRHHGQLSIRGGKRESCENEAKGFVVCGFPETVAGVPAAAGFLFVDGRLVAIHLSFSYSTDYLSSIFSALSDKLGVPAYSDSRPRGEGAIKRWENSAAIVELHEHTCDKPITLRGSLYSWGTQIWSALE